MMEKIGSVLVVGGGISGIQTALDLADSGFKVYLVEKKAGIGGTMAQLDKTFPPTIAPCASWHRSWLRSGATRTST
jgi:heterodisulfide reductase subunit A